MNPSGLGFKPNTRALLEDIYFHIEPVEAITSDFLIPSCCHSTAAAVDRSGFWGALTGMLKRRRQQRLSTVEDGIYLEDIDSDSMDPEELSQFFPSRYELLCLV